MNASLNGFPSGAVIPLTNGLNVMIHRPKGAGGVGKVYEAALCLPDGSCYPCAAKHMIRSSKATYKKVTELCSNPINSPRIAEPLGVTKLDAATDSFVYLMALAPPGFRSLVDLVRDQRRETMSFSNRIRIGINACEAVNDVHQRGYVLADIKASNFLYGLENGKWACVMVDADSIALPLKAEVKGSGLYRAPELLLGAEPSQNSDLHALAVLLYRLLIGDHPLTGSNLSGVALNEKEIAKYYGSQPEFVLDPRLKNSTYPAHTARFYALPELLQTAFALSFSQELLHGKSPRITAEDWIRYLNAVLR